MVLFVLVSGDVLSIGLAVLGIGALEALAHRRIGTSLGLCGIVLIAASAVPLHIALYVGLGFVFVVWLVLGRRSPRARLLSTGLLLVVVVLVAAVFVRERGWPPSGPADERPVFVLGDSLSAGLNAHSEGSWPSLLASRIRRPVRSFARPGARLADGIVQAQALPTGSCVVLIELGGNDILSKATAESFAADMRRLLSSVTDPHRSVVMFELPLLPMQNRYGYVQRRVSAEFGVRLIPRRVLAAAVTWPGHTTDGLHLSPAGHRWLADTVAKWL